MTPADVHEGELLNGARKSANTLYLLRWCHLAIGLEDQVINEGMCIEWGGAFHSKMITPLRLIRLVLQERTSAHPGGAPSGVRYTGYGSE